MLRIHIKILSLEITATCHSFHLSVLFCPHGSIFLPPHSHSGPHLLQYLIPACFVVEGGGEPLLHSKKIIGSCCVYVGFLQNKDMGLIGSPQMTTSVKCWSLWSHFLGYQSGKTCDPWQGICCFSISYPILFISHRFTTTVISRYVLT